MLILALPRGRRWMDKPRKPRPNTGAGLAQALAALDDPRPLEGDALAMRAQLHIEADAARTRQAPLPLKGT